MRVIHSAIVVVVLAGCSGAETDQGLGLGKGPPIVPKDPDKSAEVHLADVRQLTFGGENAEAYWSFKGDELIMQARIGDAQCDRIYRMKIDDPKNLIPVSSGKGATTCSYFLPGDQAVVYASTHLGGEACPPKPDMSQGYVWALYESYDIFRAKPDGTGVVRLTETPGYDAEATVCKDGSIVFTSVRDGDIDLYRMDSEGKNVKRLTNLPGYDGGAFFNEDCSKIVWRASRPTGKALEDYKALLAKGLVRPTKLELFVANADGSDPVQVTSLGVASFAPFFYPGSKRIIFSSNYPDVRGREFDLWAINVDGTELERITHSPGFDGFPIFSPDGRTLAFASNRATLPGKSDTNVFLAKWMDAAPQPVATAADRVAADVRFLADPARQGRGVGTAGLEQAAAHIEKRLGVLELEPAGSKGFRQGFPVPTSVKGDAKLEIDGKPVEGVQALGFSTKAAGVEADVVLAGYGIVGKTRDDYKGLDVKDKFVMVRRFVPEGGEFDDAKERRRHGDLRRKAWVAKDKGAKGILVVDVPEKPIKAPAGWKVPDEAKMPALSLEGYGDAGLAAAVVPRTSGQPILDRLAKKQKVRAKLTVDVAFETTEVHNLLGRIRAPEGQKLPGVVVIGAHYDHLGLGGHGSLAPDKKEVHPGADDNASGTAALLEVARQLAADKKSLKRDVIIAAFSGEERGVLGSSYLLKTPPPGLKAGDIYAMINMDMVGRARSGKVDVIAYDTAAEWPSILHPACAEARITCLEAQGGGYGPSDHSPFYGAGVPVLFFFSGVHGDYHKPSDTADKVHFGGVAQVAAAVTAVAKSTSSRAEKLTYKSVPSPPPNGDVRSFGASLGTVPDYAPPPGTKGMLLAGVRPGGAAEKAGLKRGDIITKIGSHPIGNVEDLMYVLTDSKPGQKVKIAIVREGREMTVEAEFQGSKPH